MKHVYEARCRRVANEVLDEVEIASYPVRPEDIARAKQVDVQTHTRFPNGCFGALVRCGNNFSIMVWSGCPTEGHRRFTIAHELGHYHLDGHVEALLPADGTALSQGGNFRTQRDPHEVEADIFASELLMPERWVRPIVDQLQPSVEAVRTLAGRFETSLSSAAIRFVSLSAEPTAAILSHNGVVEWAALSPAFGAFKWAERRNWRGEWAPKNTATRRLANDPGAIAAAAEDGGSCLLNEWFDMAPPVPVNEEATGLGSYGRVLTLLVCPNLPMPEEMEQDDEPEEEEDWRSALRSYRLG